MPVKITELDPSTTITANDLIQIIDVDSTVMSPTGTNKRVTARNAANEFGALLTDIPGIVQTALNTKANRTSPTFDGTVVLPETTSVGLVSASELARLRGVTDDIQTQLDLKAPLEDPAFTGTVTLPAGAVKSGTIEAGTIVDSDVNASAAIAGTKIAPNFGSQNIVTTGSLSAGSVAASTVTLAAAPTVGTHAATKEYVDQRTAGDTIPIGTVAYFAASTAPDSWLVCNGQSVSRTEYDVLFARLGGVSSPYGGVTTTHFNLPDLRGEFIRGWDAGRGVDTGRVFGSAQADEFKSHTHSINPGPVTTNSAGAHTHTVIQTIDQGGGYDAGAGRPRYGASGTTGSAGAHTHTIDIAAFNSASAGGTETRPRNVAMLPCIKAKTLSQIDAALLGQAAQIYATKESPTFTGTVTLPDNTVAQAKLAANVAGNGPAFRAFNSIATSIPTNSPTKVTLGTENFDTNNNFDTTLSRFTPTVAGYYQINCSVYIFNAPVGLRAEIRKNGNLVATGSEAFDRNTSSNVSDVVYCNGSSDYIEMFAYHTGTTASTQNDTARTFMSGCLIRST